MVLENGLVKEFGAPAELLKNSRSIAHSIDISTRPSRFTEETKPGSSRTEDAAEAAESDLDEEHSEEDRPQGAVSAGLYKFYWVSAGGKPLILQTAMFLFMTVAARTINNAWFVLWIGDKLGWTQGSYMTGFLASTIAQTVAIGTLTI